MPNFYDLREKGFDIEAALRFTGSDDKYVTALTRFYNAYDKNRSKIEGYLEAEDYESYCMLVHSLKSNARMIGCNDLGDIAEKLQYASQDKDIDTVEMYNDVMLLQYKEVHDIISVYATEGNSDKSADNEKIKNLASELKEALDDFDHKKSVAAYDKLSEVDFEPKEKTILNDIKDNIDAFEYDEAAELVDRLL